MSEVSLNEKKLWFSVEKNRLIRKVRIIIAKY
jgi:hypothetical protein